MLKKILLTIVVLLLAGGSLMLYGTYKVANDLLKSKEPELRQYMQMSEDEQNKYILQHADEILEGAMLEADPEEKADMELSRKVQEENPEVQKTFIDFGRSFMAKAIMHSEPIVKDMSAEAKAKYEQESNEMAERFEKCVRVEEKYFNEAKATTSIRD